MVPPGMEGLGHDVPTTKAMIGEERVLVRTDAPPVRNPSLPPELLFGFGGETPTLPGDRDPGDNGGELVVDTRISGESAAEARAAMMFVVGFAVTLVLASGAFLALWSLSGPSASEGPEPAGHFVVERG